MKRKCDICGVGKFKSKGHARSYYTRHKFKYCPNCGARMADRKTEPMKTTDYCDICKRDMCEDCIADATNPYCVPSHYEINYEPKDEPKTQMKTQNSNLTFEKDEYAKEYEELGLKELKELIKADRKTDKESE